MQVVLKMTYFIGGDDKSSASWIFQVLKRATGCWYWFVSVMDVLTFMTSINVIDQICVLDTAAKKQIQHTGCLRQIEIDTYCILQEAGTFSSPKFMTI